MSTSENKQLVRRYLEAFNERDSERLAELLTDDAVEHGIHGTHEGVGEIIEYLDGYFKAFPDYTGANEEVMAEDDLVTVRYTASGTHTGEYKNVEPTGLTATWSGISMYRIEDGKIAEIWLEEDRLGLLEQLQLVGSPAQPHLRL